MKFGALKLRAKEETDDVYGRARIPQKRRNSLPLMTHGPLYMIRTDFSSGKE